MSEDVQASDPIEAAAPKAKRTAETAVLFEGVSKRFGQKLAVNNTSFRIKKGSVCGLIGPNGAGKTTSFSMMAGYLNPSEGRVQVLDYSPRQLEGLRGRLGVLPQDALLPANDRVGEFLLHMARLQGLPADKAEQSARARLAEIEGSDWWETRCGALSHGMAKRVAFAQAMLGEPEVVLLDEPTAGLDPRVAYEMRMSIKRLRGQCTVVISSHNLQELEQICDAAIVLDRGTVVAQGRMSELTAASSEVRITLKMSRRDQQGNAYRIPDGELQGPLQALGQVGGVTAVNFENDRNEIVINFDKKLAEAEVVIGHSLTLLLQHQMLISGVSKGRGLEARVMDLTD